MLRVAKEGHKTQARNTPYRGMDCPFFFALFFTLPHSTHQPVTGECGAMKHTSMPHETSCSTSKEKSQKEEQVAANE